MKLTTKQKQRLFKAAYWKAIDGNPQILKTFLDRILDERKIKAESARDVLKLLGKGKITAKEAKTLMDTIALKTEIEMVPGLIEKIEKLESRK